MEPWLVSQMIREAHDRRGPCRLPGTAPDFSAAYQYRCSAVRDRPSGRSVVDRRSTQHGKMLIFTEALPPGRLSAPLILGATPARRAHCRVEILSGGRDALARQERLSPSSMRDRRLLRQHLRRPSVNGHSYGSTAGNAEGSSSGKNPRHKPLVGALAEFGGVLGP